MRVVIYKHTESMSLNMLQVDVTSGNMFIPYDRKYVITHVTSDLQISEPTTKE